MNSTTLDLIEGRLKRFVINPEGMTDSFNIKIIEELMSAKKEFEMLLDDDLNEWYIKLK